MCAYKLLLIDDEEAIINGLKSIIEKSGIEFSDIFVASNGRESINIMLKHQPDIVITDIKMPDIDGLELIGQINNKISKKPVFIILSGYDDFQYARKAIQLGVFEYLLKPVRKNELIEALSKIVHNLNKKDQEHMDYLQKQIQAKEGLEVLRDKCFNLLVQSGDVDKTHVFRKLSELGVNLHHDTFKVLIVDFKPTQCKSEILSDEYQMFMVKNIVDELIAGITKDHWTFFNPKMKLIVLLPLDNEFETDTSLKRIAQMMITNIVKYLDMRVYIGIGKSGPGLSYVNKSYKQALDASKHKIAGVSNGMMFYKDIKRHDGALGSDMPFFIKISGQVELYMRSAVIQLLQEKFKQLKNEKISVMELETFYYGFNRYIYDSFASKCKDYLSVFSQGENQFADFESFWSLEELEDHIKRTLLDLCDAIYSSKNKTSDKKVVDQVVAYIHSNYNKDISLSSISNYFGKSEGYLSMMFKKETGKNFIEHLTALRIEKAKELLAETNMKIYDISANVGYTNPKHFFVVFKKFMGVSPLQYRDKCV